MSGTSSRGPDYIAGVSGHYLEDLRAENARLRKALADLMPHLQLSTDISAQTAVYYSPGEQMRRAAQYMDMRDDAIRRARSALAEAPTRKNP